MIEKLRLDETARQARLAQKPKSFVTTVAVPPIPADVLRVGMPAPESTLEFSVGFNGTALGNPRASYGGRPSGSTD